jgi:hypothetical protein
MHIIGWGTHPAAGRCTGSGCGPPAAALRCRLSARKPHPAALVACLRIGTCWLAQGRSQGLRDQRCPASRTNICHSNAAAALEALGRALPLSGATAAAVPRRRLPAAAYAVAATRTRSITITLPRCRECCHSSVDSDCYVIKCCLLRAKHCHQHWHGVLVLCFVAAPGTTP